MNAEFERNGYVIARKFLDRNLCDFLSSYLWLLKMSGLTAGGTQVPNSDDVYGDCAFETLLASSRGLLCELLGIKLSPTYSFARLYYTGNVLTPHVDRPSCEVSATLSLGGEFEKIWPIYIENANGESIACHLDIGEALVYKGCERTHWREPFEGVWLAQVFMHYVDADGPYAEWKYDKRPFLGSGYSRGR